MTEKQKVDVEQRPDQRRCYQRRSKNKYMLKYTPMEEVYARTKAAEEELRNFIKIEEKARQVEPGRL